MTLPPSASPGSCPAFDGVPPGESSDRLRPLLAPRSVALLGASAVPDSFGCAMLNVALGGGFQGEIYPVNPKYREVHGRRFYPGLDALPEVAEHVVLAISSARLEHCLIDAIEHGAGAVTIFADVRSSTSSGENLHDRIWALAKESGVLVCGPGSMGFHNLDIGLRITPFPAPTDLVPGGISAIFQSGSVMGALAHNDRRLRFNSIVSTGSECSISASDYLHWMVAQPTTTVVGLFIESVRNPSQFLAALDKAEDRDIPVVMLKVGRTEKSRRMAASHSGAIIGNHEVFEAVVSDHGVHLVDTVDELAATLQIFSQRRSAAAGAVASIHDSGGERELLVDLAHDLDVPLADLSPGTVKRIAQHLEPGLKAENPLDAWGSGKGAEATFREATNAIMGDDNVAVGLYVLDWRENYYLHEMHEKILIDGAKATQKPLIGITNYSLTINSDMACRLADHGVPLIEGTIESLKAARHLLARRDRIRHVPADIEEHPRAGTFRELISAQTWPGESFGFSLLSAYGISVSPWISASTRDTVVAAAEELGYPVALKTSAPGIMHKTEARGVMLNLMDAQAVTAAYDEVCGRLGPDVLVCRMMEGASEWLVGIVNDAEFGPAVMIAPGGIMVELLDDHVVIAAPFTVEKAEDELRKLRAAHILTGFRGKPPLAFGALCEVAANVSRIAVDFHTQISEMDVNPILVSETGAIAVDVSIRKQGTDLRTR